MYAVEVVYFDTKSVENAPNDEQSHKLHNNQRHVAIDKTIVQLRTGQAVLFNHAPLCISDSKLKKQIWPNQRPTVVVFIVDSLR